MRLFIAGGGRESLANAGDGAGVYRFESARQRAAPESLAEVLSFMKLIKFLFLLLVLVLAVVGGIALFGVVLGLLKWLVILGVIALAGVGAYKLLSKSDDEPRHELSSAEAEMLKAERMLAEIRRKQLTK